MRDKLIINDTHIGVDRVTGTTPATAHALRAWLLDRVKNLMMAHTDKDIIFNGDIFDRFDVSLSDALEFYFTCVVWLGYGSKIWLGRGNHDIAKDSTKQSVFGFVASLLQNRFPDQVTVVTESTRICSNVYMIPHYPNQELFNLELDKALELLGLTKCHILLHANYNNNFAVEADHSLNVSREQAAVLVDAGHTLIFGHEHQAKHERGVYITGNQFPSSIADCLCNPEDEKRAMILVDSDVYTTVKTWKAEGSFIEVEWRDINDDTATNGYQFIRVIGHASPEEAASVIQAVSKLRQKSTAFVVANAVKISGGGDMPELELMGEEIKQFDVLNALYEFLEPAQVEVVKKLMEKREEAVA